MSSTIHSRQSFFRVLGLNKNHFRGIAIPHAWIDIPIRGIAALFFAFAAGIYFKNAFHEINWSHISASPLIDALSIVAVGLYTFMLACLYVIRLNPINKFAGVLPTITALAGCFLVSALLILPPRFGLPISIKLCGLGLVIVGNIYTVYALRWLGRSFSILPEGRHLVVTGPYRMVRNPVYLGEALSTLGAMIHFLSPWAVLIVAVQLALQLGRIHYEERVLNETFPEYADYARRTSRLIPGIY
ncbi:MAG TPA: isoprenylcysteine carboxylmethyltransferase family protein [Alphaproteobacteria bacterium]|nr:isoprenylcysteine carboxylmethyltransferase family protein [Alphaproteobacteria bacterium]